MDTYEDNGLENVQPEAPAETPQAPAPEPETVYHAEGVGQKETIFQEPSGGFYGYPSQGVYQQPAHTASHPVQPKAKKEHKLLKRAVAAVLVIALVACGCCITGTVVSNTWKEQLNATSKNFQEKIQILQQQLQDKVNNLNSSGEVVAPVEGLTPAQVYQQNLKSVVAISCQTVVNSFGQSYTTTASGSGFILTEDGYVVTNHHVIEGASDITVVTSDETEYAAELIGSDSSNDIALLKIEAEGLQKVTVGSSDALAVGSQVVAIGNALGELGSSLTVGYISGKDRDVTTDGTVITMLQTDAAINSGNSGGPLFNMQGQVVGITTAKYSGETSSGASIEGIGFAIPVDDVIGMLEDLRDYGYITGVQLGVMVRNIDSEIASAYGFPMGAYVNSVNDDSCAQKAGIQAKDIIIEVGGYEVENLNDLTRALRKFKAGDEATVKVWRSGQELILNVVFDAKSQS